MPDITSGNIAVVLSTLLAAWLVYRLWRSDDHLFFKVTLSVLAFIPVVGPLMLLFYGVTPPRQAEVFRGQDRHGGDVYARWRHVLEERSPVRRFRAWRGLVQDNEAPDTAARPGGPDEPRP